MVDHTHKIFQTIENFIINYENATWIATAPSETIVNVFKTGTFVEKACQKVEASQEPFLIQLHKYLQTKNISKQYSFEFLSTALDHVLRNFLTNQGHSNETVVIALRVYISLAGAKRFKKVLTSTILYVNSYKKIIEYVQVDSVEIENLILLENWVHSISIGNAVDVRLKINSLVESQLAENIETVLSLACMSDLKGQHQSIVLYGMNQIIDLLNSTLVDNQKLWNVILKEIECGFVAKVCEKNDEFFDTIIKYAIEIRNDKFLLDLKSESGNMKRRIDSSKKNFDNVS